MSKIKVSLVLAMATCAFSAIAAPALAFTEFVAKDAPVQIKAIGHVQTFETGGSVSVECNRVEATAEAQKVKVTTLKVDVKYTQCEVKAFAQKFPAEMSQVKYLLNANGTISFENAIRITVPIAGCEITVTPQSNQDLKAVTYTDVTGQTNKEVEADFAVEGITQTTKGSPATCGKSSNVGKDKGKVILRAAKGDLEVI